MTGLTSVIHTKLTRFKANIAIIRANVKRKSIADALEGDATKAEIQTNEDA